MKVKSEANVAERDEENGRAYGAGGDGRLEQLGYKQEFVRGIFLLSLTLVSASVS